ncbi:uncharacterized protein LOC100827131 [Brachypodium distachyon]|uniref:NAC domain-containing protein n=1 Tax=Brachypodium distachyon TaxID=15368 RepID=A0A2K2CHY2_BRADI|nr:uncharacterized protein LOC100827131 [Brachypodium distachyon]PNT61630.1 hypothetical protein BRADI_5g18044v3 [Brachypodium distachyon]|eukprot:XP_024311838.1 uncharacterized protein LOC100827131 [Brachypodium distachyon]
MAEGEEQKKSGEEGEEKKSTHPPGFRFMPTDEELVEYYLLPRLQGRPHVPNDCIIEDNVYRCHPDELIDGHKDKGETSWYFLTPRSRKYTKGDRPDRCTDDHRGRWKASTGKTEIEKETVGNVRVKFFESTLGYHVGPVDTETKTKWLMRELSIKDFQIKLDQNSMKLDEYVMCRIYVTPRHKSNNDDEAGPSGTSTCQEQEASPAPSQPEPVESGAQAQGGAAPNKLSARQKGKRPVEAMRRGPMATPKRGSPLDLLLGPPAPLHAGGGMQPPFWPGRPMVNRARTSMMAFSGRVGPRAHTSMPRPPMAFMGQVRPSVHASMPRPPMAFSGQVPRFRAAHGAAAAGNFGQAMMMQRHMNPAGQAFRLPPPPTVTRSPEERMQPETEEMSEQRVLQQLENEWMMHAGGMVQAQQQPATGNVAAYPTQPMAFTEQHEWMCGTMEQQPGNVTYATQQPHEPMAFFAQQEQEQQLYFDGDDNRHQYLGQPMVLQSEFEFTPCNYQHVEVGQQFQSGCAVVVPDSAAATTPLAASTAEVQRAEEPEPETGARMRGQTSEGNATTMRGSALLSWQQRTGVLPDGTSASADDDGTRHDSQR